MNFINEHNEDEWPKLNRPDVAFNKKEALKKYAVSDEEVQKFLLEDYFKLQLSEEFKSKLKREKESIISTYFWISAMAASWLIAFVLRSYIVIPEASAPVEIAYERPAEKLILDESPKDSAPSSISIECPESYFEMPNWYCGNYYGVGELVYPNDWLLIGNDFYPPRGNSDVVNWTPDTTKVKANSITQDSILVAKIDSSFQQFKKAEQHKEYLSVRELIAMEIDERVQKIRRVRQFIRSVRLRNSDEQEDRMVIEWKGKRIGL